MGRSKKKRTEEVLNQCCQLFWQKGYAQTSVKDIEEATGLKSGSVYHHFQNKEKLFEEVLEYYISSVVEPRLQEFLFIETGSGKKNIRNVFDSVVRLPEEYRWVGCLMTNSSVEVQQQAHIKKRIQAIFELFEKGFLYQLNRIPEIKKKPLKYRKQLAGNLLIAMEGFFVLVRLNNDTKQLKQYVDNAMFVLNNT